MKNEIKSESSPAPAGGHTPLPWLLTDGLVYRDATGQHVTQQLCHEYGRAALMLTHDGSEEGYANAELAKLACNSHAALLAERDRLREALECVIKIIEHNCPSEASPAIALAQAALAEGGKPQPKLKTAAALRVQDTAFLHYPHYSEDDTSESEPL